MACRKKLLKKLLLLTGVLAVTGVSAWLVLSNYLHALRPAATDAGTRLIATSVDKARRPRVRKAIRGPLETQLEATPRVRVVVTSPNGRPVAGAQVDVVPSTRGSAWNPEETHGVTNGDGAVALIRPSTGLFDVAVRAQGYAPKRTQAWSPSVDVVLSPSGPLQGSVLESSTHRPVHGAQVRIRAMLSDAGTLVDDDIPAEVSATTDSDGRFRVDDAPIGRHVVDVQHDSFAAPSPVPVDVLPSGTPDLRIFLARALTVSGFVRDARSRAPITTGSIVVVYGAGKETHPAALSSDGHFIAHGIESAAVAFRVLSDGWDPSLGSNVAVTPVWDSATGTLVREAEVHVAAAVVVVGRVEDDVGAPVEDAMVVVGGPNVMVAAREVIRLGLPGANRFGMGRSGRSGAFRVTLPATLNDARLWAIVLHPEFAPLLRPLDVAAMSGDDVRLTLDRGSELTVRVAPGPSAASTHLVRLGWLDPERVSVSGFELTDFLWPVQVTDGGVATFEHCTRGRWRVDVASHDGRYGATVEVSIPGAGAHEVSVELDERGSISGHVTDASGVPLAGASVLLPQVPAPHRATVTDVQGEFHFSNVAEPSARIRVSNGYVTSEAVVRRGEPASIVMPSDDSELVVVTVRDADTMRPVAWGSVRATVPLPGGGTREVRGSVVEGATTIRVRRVLGCTLEFSVPGYAVAQIDATTPSFEDVILTPIASPSASIEVKIPRSFSPLLEVVAYDAVTGVSVAKGTLISSEVARMEVKPDMDLLIHVVARHGYLERPESVRAAADQHCQLTVAMSPGGGFIKGVTDVPVSQVLLRDRFGIRRALPTSEDGSFFSGPVAPGSYWLECDGRVTARVDVAEGETKTVDTRRGQR